MYYVPICIPYQSVHPWAFSITPLSLVILGFLSQILRPKPHHDDFTVRDTAGPAYQCSPSSSHSRPNVEGQRLGGQTCSTASASVHFATIPYSSTWGMRPVHSRSQHRNVDMVKSDTFHDIYLHPSLILVTHTLFVWLSASLRPRKPAILLD